MKSRKHLKGFIIIVLFTLVILFLVYLILRKKPEKIIVPPELEIIVTDSTSNITMDFSTVGITAEQQDSSLLSPLYQVEASGTPVPEFVLRFDKQVLNLSGSGARIAMWTGEGWQELKTCHDERYIRARSEYQGIYTLKECPKTAILMVHGLGGSHETWSLIIDNRTLDPRFFYRGNYRCLSTGDTNFEPSDFSINSEQSTLIYTLDFSDNQNLNFDQQAAEVARVIPKMLEDSQADKVLLIGHSMGGLATRAYINNYGTRKVAGYISVTSPHMGSFLASIKRWANDENYEDDLTGNLSLRMKSLLVRLLKSVYPAISINALALDYLEPGSEELKKIHEPEFPEHLPVATITSVWEMEGKNNILRKRALSRIATSLERKYNPRFSKAQIKKYNMEERKSRTDGVVCYHSQILEASIPNGGQINPWHFNTNVFHTMTNKESVVCEAIDSIFSIYY